MLVRSREGQKKGGGEGGEKGGERMLFAIVFRGGEPGREKGPKSIATSNRGVRGESPK